MRKSNWQGAPAGPRRMRRLAPGAAVVVTLGARQGECLYDLRAVFEDGRAETAHRVNVCETQTWDYPATPSA